MPRGSTTTLLVIEFLALNKVQASTAHIVSAIIKPNQTKSDVRRAVLQSLDVLMGMGSVKTKQHGLGYAYRHATTSPDAEIKDVPHGRPKTVRSHPHKTG